MTDIAESVHYGIWTSHPNQNWWFGMAEGGVELAPFSDIVPNDVIMFEKAKQDEITKGELTVFSGMSDEDLSKMNYLEPNVVGELPKS
jgi:basic membrane lipoprotein Med (substrate-binding protein (PBP1-ABC) superfamily)